VRTIARNIGFLRGLRGWTQDELRIKMSKSRATISYWEREKELPKDEEIKRLAKLFRVSANKLKNEKITYADKS
jgi:transcriptional regulator with XRE-family HTH domain